MRKLMLTLLLVAVVPFVIGGCDDDDNPTIVTYEPAPPQGVYSVTGDGQVTIWWNGPYESNIAEYVVYRSLNETTGYVEIGSVEAEPNPDLDLLIYSYVDNNVANGVTYYYAVTSVNTAGYESELSAENVYDTPRPDGQGMVLFPIEIDTNLAGFSFAAQARVSMNNPLADIVVDRPGSISYLNAANDQTDIQDMGYTDGFDDITYAPQNGWSQLGYVEAIVGHTYVVWTADDNYAKVRITAIAGNGAVTFDWGYQTDTGNPELIAPLNAKRPVHNANYLKKQSISTRSSE